MLGPTVLTRDILVPRSFLPHFNDLFSSTLHKLEAPWSKACLAPRMHRVMQFPLWPFCTATLQARQGRVAHAHRLPACLPLPLTVPVGQMLWRAETNPMCAPWDWTHSEFPPPSPPPPLLWSFLLFVYLSR